MKIHNFHHRSHSSSLFITLRLCDHHRHGIAQSALPLNPWIEMFSDSVYFQCFPMQSRTSLVGKQFPRENIQIYMLSTKQGAKYHRLYESHIMGGRCWKVPLHKNYLDVFFGLGKLNTSMAINHHCHRCHCGHD